MEVYIYGLPAYIQEDELREKVAHILHSDPISARNPQGKPLNFSLWLSQPERRLPTSKDRQSSANYQNLKKPSWSFAKLIIPDNHIAKRLVEHTKVNPFMHHGKTMKFVLAGGGGGSSSGGDKPKLRTIPAQTIRRLLDAPYQCKQHHSLATQREHTADTLRRGTNVHLFQLGTINREGEFASEHSVYDAAKVKMVPPTDPSYQNHRGKGANQRNNNAQRQPKLYPEYRCIIGCEPGFRGMYVRILKREKYMTFRMHPCTIEQIVWSHSSGPEPAEPWLPRPPRRNQAKKNGEPTFAPKGQYKQEVSAVPTPNPTSTQINGTETEQDDVTLEEMNGAIDDGEGEQVCIDRPEPQDVIIRLSQPLILEQTIRATNNRTRLSAIPSKPHISPYCFTTLFISGYNIVEALQAMSEMRFRSDALAMVEEKLKTMSIPMAFQYQKLLSNCVLDPTEVLQAMDLIEEAFVDDGEPIRIRTLMKLASDDALARTKIESALVEGFRPIDLKDRITLAEIHASGTLPGGVIEDESFHEVLQVYITPTALQLHGPNYERSNRILRQYRAKKQHFIRVSFCDEDLGNSNFVGPNKGYDMAAFLKLRFGTAMKEGIMIAGRLYEFLAYSQSSLREATVWFMTPFEHDGKTITAERIRISLGNFDHIKNCPARYAARLSQAFSATHKGFQIDQSLVKRIAERERNGKCFSDGAGKISPMLAKEVQESIASKINKPRNPASGLQIRIAGCKGMVFVDPRLTGRKLCIRPSMIKFVGSSCEIEVAEAFSAPKPFNLNRPLIKILEDLGVPFEPLLKLQRAMETGIYQGIRSIGSASIWLDKSGFGTAFHAPTIFKMLHRHRISFGNLPPQLAKFLQCSLTYAAIKALRNIKYRSRIYLPDCWTVVGGIDESGTLEEGEVFVCIKPEKGNTAAQYISGQVAVTRSPQMWPGDVRMLKAIGRPTSPFLAAQTNVIMFSSKGSRPEQDKMSGGDLDGDTCETKRLDYNIITQAQPGLLPRRIVEPASYPAAPQKKLPRPSTIADVADFVCEYMNNDYMGMVANAWLVTADTAVLGSEDLRCKKLAELYSIAVDFPKSGTPVEAAKLPKPDSRKKPDFMIKPHEKISEEDSYESQRYLGRLFRDIQLPRVIYSDQGKQPTFANFKFDDLASRTRPDKPPLNYDDLPFKLAKDYLPDHETYKDVFAAKADKLAKEFYDHMVFCARTFRIDEEDQLSEEECFLTMVGTPVRSVRRHEQGMRLTLYITNFLNNLREELSSFDDQLEPMEDVQCAIGLAYTLWLISRDDFELGNHGQFGCHSLNLIAFEAIVSNIERLEELIELSYPAEERVLPHLADEGVGGMDFGGGDDAPGEEFE
ncbi:RdRP-domain-containing protein [Cystobasidium minutum MCA 4210]|uniref:RdRP-domain-containing protein n=1 Tax=Cystobasidium minutum MCA 4210 TaxID=1397322 RepID=UPI0034CFD302|eukprot:jgi/Rhomi1/177240/fgenesh1_pg.1_\